MLVEHERFKRFLVTKDGKMIKQDREGNAAKRSGYGVKKSGGTSVSRKEKAIREKAIRLSTDEKKMESKRTISHRMMNQVIHDNKESF